MGPNLGSCTVHLQWSILLYSTVILTSNYLSWLHTVGVEEMWPDRSYFRIGDDKSRADYAKYSKLQEDVLSPLKYYFSFPHISGWRQICQFACNKPKSMQFIPHPLERMRLLHNSVRSTMWAYHQANTAPRPGTAGAASSKLAGLQDLTLKLLGNR